MVDPSGIEGFQPRKVRNMEQLKKELGKPTDLRMFAIAQVQKALPYTVLLSKSRMRCGMCIAYHIQAHSLDCVSGQLTDCAVACCKHRALPCCVDA
jgi:hypothetical protein